MKALIQIINSVSAVLAGISSDWDAAIDSASKTINNFNDRLDTSYGVAMNPKKINNPNWNDGLFEDDTIIEDMLLMEMSDLG